MVPNLVTLIAREGKVVHLEAQGYLDIDSRKPATVDSIFRLYSNSKPIAGTAVMMLYEEGLLKLDDPVSKYIPAFKNPLVLVPMGVGIDRSVPPSMIRTMPARREVTIRDCLRNTTGLATPQRSPFALLTQYREAIAESGWDLMESLNAAPRISYRERVEAHARLPLVFEPGTEFEYHVGYPVIGVIIEQIAGKNLEESYQERIFKPLGMKDTGFHISADKRDRVAQPLKLNPLTGQAQRIQTTAEEVHFECGGGCSLGTVGDYVRFGQMLMNGGRLDGHQILSPATVRLMTSNHLGKDIVNRVANVEPHREGYGFGLGVAVRMEPGLASVPGNAGEYSWNGAYGTGFFADPQEKLVVVYGTAAPGDLRKYYREQVQDLVYGAMTR